MMALHHRNVNGGRGQVVDVALYEAVFSMMESLVPEFDVLGFMRERAGNALPGIMPSNTYPTRDGKFVIIGANNDAIFKRMMTAIGRSRSRERCDTRDQCGPRAAHGGTRRRDRRLDAHGTISTPCSRRSKRAEVPSGKVYDVADIVKDAHYIARGMLEQHAVARRQADEAAGDRAETSDDAGRDAMAGPKLGEHTDEILASARLQCCEPARFQGARRDMTRDDCCLTLNVPHVSIARKVT